MASLLASYLELWIMAILAFLFIVGCIAYLCGKVIDYAITLWERKVERGGK